MHDAVNNITIMECYCYGAALSDRASGGPWVGVGGEWNVNGLPQKRRFNIITLFSSQYLLG